MCEAKVEGLGQNLDVEVEVEAKFKRPRPNLKRPNRTLYFTVKIYAVKTLYTFWFVLFSYHYFFFSF